MATTGPLEFKLSPFGTQPYVNWWKVLEFMRKVAVRRRQAIGVEDGWAGLVIGIRG